MPLSRVLPINKHEKDVFFTKFKTALDKIF